jgi:MFS family permease
MNVSAPRVNANGRAAIAAILLGGLIVIATSAMSYLVFLALATVPAFTASLLERPGRRQATASVGALTMATALPLILGAIATGSERDLLRSSTAWLFVAAAAVIGIGIYFMLPILAVWVEDMRASARLRKMRERQQALVNDWGAEVAGR